MITFSIALLFPISLLREAVLQYLSCVCRLRKKLYAMTSCAEIKDTGRMLQEVEHLKGILNSMRPSSFPEDYYRSDFVKEQEVILKKLLRKFAVTILNLEYGLKEKAMRISGLKEVKRTLYPLCWGISRRDSEYG